MLSAAASASPLRRWFNTDRRNLLFITIGGLLIAWLLFNNRDYPIRDECIYLPILANFRATHIYTPPQLEVQPNLIGIIWLAWIWISLFGDAINIVALMSLLLALLGLLGFYLLLRELEVSPMAALSGVALLGLNPFYIHLSGVFMTDIPFVTFTIYACLCYLFGLRGKGEAWLWLGSLLAGYGFLIRQYAVLIPLALLIYLLLIRRLRRRELLACLLPTFIFAAGFLVWQITHPLDQNIVLHQTNSFIFTLDWPRVILSRVFAYLPLLGLFTWPLLQLRRRWLLIWLGLVALALVGIAANPPIGGLFPNTFDYDGNLLTRAGFDLFLYDDPSVLGNVGWDILRLLGMLAGLLLLAQMGEWLSDWLDKSKRQLSPSTFIYILGILIAVITFAFSGLSFDRYLLAFWPMLIVFVIRGSTTWGRIGWAYFVAGLVLLGSFSLLLQADYSDHARARWAAGQQILAQGVAPADVWVGSEWLTWYGNSTDEELPYRVAEQPPTGYRLVNQIPYFSRLGGFSTRYIGIWMKEPAH